VVNVACAPEQVENVHPGLSEVIVVVFTVVQSMFSLQLITTLLLSDTFAAASVGLVLVTVGAVLSRVTVMPAPGFSTLLDESVALL
jgi:hypothetical protein